jgi:hypothetical protein
MRLPALDGDAWVAFLGTFLEGFPDLHLEVLDTVADDKMNAQRILFTGTHTGVFRGLPPTGRTVHFSGLEISRMVDGKAAEHWFQMDTLTLFEQLGLRVVPGPPTESVGDVAITQARRSSPTMWMSPHAGLRQAAGPAIESGKGRVRRRRLGRALREQTRSRARRRRPQQSSRRVIEAAD